MVLFSLVNLTKCNSDLRLFHQIVIFNLSNTMFNSTKIENEFFECFCDCSIFMNRLSTLMSVVPSWMEWVPSWVLYLLELITLLSGVPYLV